MSLLPRRERAREFSFRKVYGFFYENRFVGSCISFGILDSKLPKGSTLISQGMAPIVFFVCVGEGELLLRYLHSCIVLWGSIGWSVGACLGAALAAREQGRRTILFVGEGSLQLTVQEVRMSQSHLSYCSHQV